MPQLKPSGAGSFMLAGVMYQKGSLQIIPDATAGTLTIKRGDYVIFSNVHYSQFTDSAGNPFASLAALLGKLDTTAYIGDSGPSQRCAAITPDNSNDLPGGAPRAIQVGQGGNITCTIDGVDVLFENIPTGDRLPVCPTRVKATGTTATKLIALY